MIIGRFRHFAIGALIVETGILLVLYSLARSSRFFAREWGWYAVISAMNYQLVRKAVYLRKIPEGGEPGRNLPVAEETHLRQPWAEDSSGFIVAAGL